MLRVPFLVPLLGVRVAEFVEMPLMFVVILLAAQFVVARFALESAAQRAGCGLLHGGGAAEHRHLADGVLLHLGERG